VTISPVLWVYSGDFASDKIVKLFRAIECPIEYEGSRFQNGCANSLSQGCDCFLEAKRAAAKFNDGLSKMGASIYRRLRTPKHFSIGSSDSGRG
jgi:hypothetical protein